MDDGSALISRSPDVIPRGSPTGNRPSNPGIVASDKFAVPTTTFARIRARAIGCDGGWRALHRQTACLIFGVLGRDGLGLAGTRVRAMVSASRGRRGQSFRGRGDVGGIGSVARLLESRC